MVAKGTDCLLYPAPDGSLTLATRKTLLHALTLKGLPLTAPLAVLTPTPLIGLPLGSYLFDALLLMTRHRIKRLVIWQQGEVAGILQLTQVLGLFSTHSHVLTLRIARAKLSVSAPTSRWLMIELLSWCRYSIGSSRVTMWRARVELM